MDDTQDCNKEDKKMRVMTFPRNNGLDFEVDITENADKSITISDFTFTILGESQNITGDTYTLAPGDTIYITPVGLEHGVYVPDVEDSTKGACAPASVMYQATGTAYWLVCADSKTGELTRLEVA